jgi:hypothetical protein
MYHAIRRLGLTLAVAVTALCGLAMTAVPARTADLLDGYHGGLHHVKLDQKENLDLHLAFAVGPSGKITGVFATSIPLNKVKVTAKGVVTFSGKLDTPEGSVTVSGAGQVSATGRFLVGSLTLKGTGVWADDAGIYTFHGDNEA